MQDTIVVGLDGAHWELLDPWIKSGELPAIEKLRSKGVSGELISCLPPVTCPNWKCYSTGQNPGKLGVYWWEIVDKDQHKITSSTGADFTSLEIWDYLNKGGIETGIINMPTTYPPRELDGYLVSGGPDSESRGYAYPQELEHDLESRGYMIRPPDIGLLPDKKKNYLKKFNN